MNTYLSQFRVDFCGRGDDQSAAYDKMLPGIDAINSAIASTAETNAAKPRWQGATGLPESERTHPTQPTQLTQEMKPEAPAEEERPPPSETEQPLRLMHPPAVPEGFYGAPQQSRPTVTPPPSHTAEQAAWLEMQGRVNPTPPGPWITSSKMTRICCSS